MAGRTTGRVAVALAAMGLAGARLAGMTAVVAKTAVVGLVGRAVFVFVQLASPHKQAGHERPHA